jgi:hypothetical protein
MFVAGLVIGPVIGLLLADMIRWFRNRSIVDFLSSVGFVCLILILDLLLPWSTELKVGLFFGILLGLLLGATPMRILQGDRAT